MSEDGADLHFDSPEQEIKHWKSKVADMQDALRETESSLQDFMESSKELEAEMEKELNLSNKTIADLKRRNEHLTGDLEDWKAKYSRALSEHNSTLTDLQRELALLKDSVDIYKAKLRDTEMTNDELENAERMIASSLADMEGRYNKTIEKTALLEQELIEKSKLEEENQRLKDELREMTEEMAVLRDVVGRSRAVSRADTFNSSVTDDQPQTVSTDLSPRKAAAAATISTERPSSRQALPSPSLGRVPISRRLGAMGHNRRTSRDVRDFASMNGDSPNTTMMRTPASGVSRRETLTAGGIPSSPSARAQLRASVRAATRSSIPPTPRTPATPAKPGSKRMMADMIAKMKALETRINSAKDLSRVVGPGDESAIPRPSSRMAGGGYGSPGHNSIHMPTSTPRAPRMSMDGNRTIGSSIPVPSRVRRPSSRMSERGTPPLPSLGLPRSQTPSQSYRGASPLDFMDHDPASSLPHAARYAAAQAAISRRRSSVSGLAASASSGSLAKIRTGSSAVSRSVTPATSSSRASSAMRINGSSTDAQTGRTPLSTRLASGHRPNSSIRGSITGPPSSWKTTLSRSRSGSVGSSEPN